MEPRLGQMRSDGEIGTKPMFIWTTIFAATALAAAPFALGDIAHVQTANAAFSVMALFATLALVTAAVGAARRVSGRSHRGGR